MFAQLIKDNLEIFEIVLKDGPWILLGLWFVYSVLMVFFKFCRRRFSNFFIIDSIPNVFVTLGLLGTFCGIVFGLLEFNTAHDQIKLSIETLLEGLKQAMWTSIVGIICSLFFAKIIKSKINNVRIEPPKTPELFELESINRNILELNNSLRTTHYNALVDSLRDVLGNFNNVLSDFISDLVNENFSELTSTINQLNEWQIEHRESVRALTEEYRTLVSRHSEFVERTNDWVSRLDEIAGQSSRLQGVIDEFNSAFSEEGDLSRLLGELGDTVNELRTTSQTVRDAASTMSETSTSLASTASHVDEWTDRLREVSDHAQRIVDSAETLHEINGTFDQRLARTFGSLDSLMRSYINDLENRSE